MRVLYVTPRFPYPLLKGDQVVPYHRLRVLSRKHEITLLSMYEKEEELDGISKIMPFCSKIHTIRLSKAQSLMNIALRAPFSQLPLQVLYYYSPELKRKLQNLLSNERFDLVHSYLLRTAPALSEVTLPVVADLIDSMQLNIGRRVPKERPPKRWIFQEELRRITSYEKRMGDLFDQLVVVSSLDKEYIPGNVHVIPNGVDTDEFIPAQYPTSEPVIIFTGNMGYAPNIHAVTWFVHNCFNRIRAAIPNVRFVIAGANPSKEILSFSHQPGITVTGFVRSIVDTLHQASVAIAPMQTGSGIQNKILEAMACELPVIATTLGKGSLGAEPGHAIIVADDPVTYADQIIDLLQNVAQAKTLGRNARDFVLSYHSWEHAGEQVDRLYQQVIASKVKKENHVASERPRPDDGR